MKKDVKEREKRDQREIQRIYAEKIGGVEVKKAEEERKREEQKRAASTL